MIKGVGSISLLIDSPLRDLALALRTVGPETRAQINSATKSAAQPIWFDETRGRAGTRIQQRALVNTTRVGVTSRNVILRAGGAGKLSSGTAIRDITDAAEWGAGAGKVITSRSSKGKAYKRRLGNSFPRVGDGVIHGAAKQSIKRIASLWVQTARRTIHEASEKVG